MNGSYRLHGKFAKSVKSRLWFSSMALKLILFKIYGRVMRLAITTIFKSEIMKLNFQALFVVSALIYSCSTDKENVEDTIDVNAIIGEWQVIELQINDQTASDNAKFGKQILDYLTARDCYILTFNFNADLTVSAENSANYLEIGATASGLVVPCPTQTDTSSSTYTYDGSVLTTIDESGNQVSVDVTINGEIMTVDAADLDIPNFNDEGKLIFMKI